MCKINRIYLYLFCLFAAFQHTASVAEENKFVQGAAQGPVYVYRVQGEYGWIKESLEAAIVNKGLTVSNVLHIGEMLERTAADVGITEDIYRKAESLEFCSVVMAHKMFSVNPANIAICPLTVAVYVKTGEPDTVYASFRRITLAGEGANVTAEVEGLMHGIVKEGLGLE